MAKQQNVGVLIGATRRRLKQAVGRLVRPHGLSGPQFWILITIAEHDGLSLRELTDGLGVDAPTASRIVAGLTRRRLVRVTGDASDRRRCRLTVTDKARPLAERLLPVAQQVRNAIVTGFSPAERETLRGLLLRVMANMETLHPVTKTRNPRGKLG